MVGKAHPTLLPAQLDVKTSAPPTGAAGMANYPGLDVTGKVCLVTGGTSGIGRAIALGFAQAGARVMAGSTNPEKVAAVRQELSQFGTGHDAVRLDVADEQSVTEAVAATVERFGRLDAV